MTQYYFQLRHVMKGYVSPPWVPPSLVRRRCSSTASRLRGAWGWSAALGARCTTWGGTRLVTRHGTARRS